MHDMTKAELIKSLQHARQEIITGHTENGKLRDAMRDTLLQNVDLRKKVAELEQHNLRLCDEVEQAKEAWAESERLLADAIEEKAVVRQALKYYFGKA